MTKNYTLIVFSVLFFLSCHNTPPKLAHSPQGSLPQLTTDQNVCADTNQQIQVAWDYLKKWHLWNDKLPQTMPDATSVEELVNQIMSIVPQDKWSQVNPLSYYQQLINGEAFLSLGLKVGASEDQTSLIVLDVYNQELKQVIKRGDRIIFVNDRQIANWLATDKDTLQTYFGNLSETKVTNIKIDWLDANDSLHTQIFKPSPMSSQSVRATNTYELNGQKVGYIAYDSFDEPSLQALAQTFIAFKQQNIQDLILDLRYNAGGAGHVSNHLASLIAGIHVKNRVFNRKTHNASKQHADTNVMFAITSENAQLNLPRLFVLTTKRTTSASEMLINNLKPYIEVTTIGTTTNGKPVGMQVTQLCDHVLFTSTHLNVNADGEGEFFQGIPATCLVEDPVKHTYGDEQDPVIRQALDLIYNEKC